MSFFLFKVGQRVKEIAPPQRHGTIVKITRPGNYCTIFVRLDGLGIASFPPSALSLL